MGLALTNADRFESVQCCQCGIVFWVPEHWEQNRRRTQAGFHCPNGHALSYSENIVEKLKQRITGLESSLSFEQSRSATLDRRLKQEAGKHRALKKRIGAGVCPCCHRTVRQLAAHMKTQHPEYPAVEAPAEGKG